MEKDIIVISDLHIGDGGSRDNFGHPGSNKAEQLSLFLDYVSEQNGELIILGDLFEFWQANFSKVIVNNLPLLDRLAQHKLIYILGNHDSDLKYFKDTKLLSHNFFKKIEEPFSKNIGGKKFYFMHGHEIDPANKGDSPGIGRAASIIAGIAEDHFGPNIGDKSTETLLLHFWETFKSVMQALWQSACEGGGDIDFTKTKELLSPAQNPKFASEMLLHYKDHREKEKYDIAVVGHTHKPGCMDNWYFNSGSWATSDNNFIRITSEGKVQVFDWINGQPVESNTVLFLPEHSK